MSDSRLINALNYELKLPGENRVVDHLSALKLRAAAFSAAVQLRFDKITTAVTLLDFAVLLLSLNEPRYGPERVVEAFQESVQRHYNLKGVGR